MDRQIKRTQAEEVRRRVIQLVAVRGFGRTKPAFWTRPAGPMVEFVHLHLYRSGAEFRVHLGIRVLNDPFAAVALNGPASHPTDPYDHTFDASADSVVRCAHEVARYCDEVGEPWFVVSRGGNRLLDADSPLDADARSALRDAQARTATEARIARSRSLLGVV